MAWTAMHGHGVFARLDVGVDQEIDPRSETFLHLNAGLGFGNTQWSAAAELQSVFVDGDSAQAAGASVRYHGATAAPYLSVTAPVGGALSGDVIMVTAGASFF